MFTYLKRFTWRASLLATVVSLLAFTVALAASGDLDTTFSGDGRVTTDFGGREDIAYDTAIQSNGKILAAGRSYDFSNNYDFFLTRYNPNGSLDITFSGDGKLITNFGGVDQAWDVAVQSDGKIIAAGFTCDTNFNNCDVALARYNPGGALDTTFSGDGKVVTDFGGGNNGTYGGLTIQSDGKIVVAGWMLNGSANDFAVYRYNPNGSLDITFSGDGKVNFGFGADRQDVAYTLAIQKTDGRIVVAGYSGDVSYEHDNFAIARLNPNGTLDKTFSGDGKQTTDFGGNDFAYGFAGYADGRMIVVGKKINTTSSLSSFAIARYTSSGVLDTTFNGTGKKVFSIVPGLPSYANDAVVQPDGKIVVFGAAETSDAFDFTLVRLNLGGGFDTTFSGDGKVTVDFCSGNDKGNTIARQASDGKYVLAGSTDCGVGGDFAVVRVLP